MRFLELERNRAGSYLIRDSDNTKGDYVLAVKIFDDDEQKFKYLQYKIHHSNGSYFLTKKQKFKSLVDFAKRCEENAIRVG